MAMRCRYVAEPRTYSCARTRLRARQVSSERTAQNHITDAMVSGGGSLLIDGGSVGTALGAASNQIRWSPTVSYPRLGPPPPPR
jgi:hypothetical protein